MRKLRIVEVALLALVSYSIARSADAQAGGGALEDADDAFKAGKFANAEKWYAQVVAADSKNYAACVRLGEIALLSNRFPEAEKWLKKALEIRADDAVAKTLLAETYYRQDDFEHAAEMLKTPGTGENPGRTHFSSLDYEKLASFKGQTPYQLSGSGEAVRLKLLRTDPLPLVAVRINGGKEVVFFVDTGGAEIGLDTAFAKELALPLWKSSDAGTFADRPHIESFHSRIDSIAVGDWAVKNVPVQVLGLRALSSTLGVPRIDGVLGTIFLYHFLSTIDYTAGELVLRKRTAENLRRLWAVQARKSVSAPFWMAADHFIVGWGRVGALPPTLFFLDSGLAGADVNFPDSTLQAANIVLDNGKAEKGQGTAGTFESIPYVVPEVLFAGLAEQQVKGLRNGPLFWEDGLGFHIGGMIGHEFLRTHAVTFDFDGMALVFH